MKCNNINTYLSGDKARKLETRDQEREIPFIYAAKQWDSYRRNLF